MITRRKANTSSSNDILLVSPLSMLASVVSGSRSSLLGSVVLAAPALPMSPDVHIPGLPMSPARTPKLRVQIRNAARVRLLTCFMVVSLGSDLLGPLADEGQVTGHV